MSRKTAAATHRVMPVRLLSAPDAAAYIGVSVGTLDKLVTAGLMPRPRVWREGASDKVRRRLYDVRELDDAIDAMPHDGADATGWEDAGYGRF